MINLLPEGEKQEIFKRRRWKLWLIFEVALFLFLVSLAFVFLTSRVYLAGELVIQQEIIAEREKEVGLQAITDFQKQVADLDLTLQNVKSFYQRQPNLTAVFQALFETLPTEVSLTTLSFIQDPATDKINVTGFAPTREDLLLFKENLESNSVFQKVNFPPTTWVSPTDIEFSLSLELKSK